MNSPMAMLSKMAKGKDPTYPWSFLMPLDDGSWLVSEAKEKKDRIVLCGYRACVERGLAIVD